MTKPTEKPLTREQILALPKADPNDPAEIAGRAKWKEEDAAVNALLPRYEEIGRRIANGETVEIGSDLPGAAAVVYGLTGGKEGKPPTGEKQTTAAFLLAIFLRGAYRRRLAERYLEETGCTLQQARRVRVMRAGMVGPGLEELSEENRAEFFRADELLLDLAEYCDTLAATTPGARDGVPVSTNFSEEDVTEARELVERELDNGTADNPGAWLTSGDRLQGSFMAHSAARKAADIYLQVRPSGKHVTLEEAEAAIVRFLSATAADPANPPATPREWLAKQGRGSELQALEEGIFLLAQEATERELEETKRALEEKSKRLEASDAENTRLRRSQNNQLPNYTRYSGAALDNLTGGPRWQAEQLTFLEVKGAAGLLDMEPTAEQLEGWRETVSGVNPVHWNLSVPEWRLLHAVISLYAIGGIDGDSYRLEHVPEDWPRLYQLAGIPEHINVHGHRGKSGTRRAELKEASGHLASRRVQVFISLKKPNGRWDTAVPEVQLLERVPVWNDLSDEENRALREKPPERWPEPSGWLLRLPVALRSGLTRYFREVPADLWERLEQAADGKHTDNVIRFVLKLYQLQPGDSATVRLSRETLADALPVLAGFAEQRQWSRFERTVSNAAAIAARAGLLQDAGGWEKGRGPQGGRVFVCERLPAAFPMLNKATQHALEVPVSGAKVPVSGAKVPVSGARVTRKPKRGNGL